MDDLDWPELPDDAPTNDYFDRLVALAHGHDNDVTSASQLSGTHKCLALYVCRWLDQYWLSISLIMSMTCGLHCAHRRNFFRERPLCGDQARSRHRHGRRPPKAHDQAQEVKYSIYIIRNTSNGRVYVGSTELLASKRYRQHRRDPPQRMRKDALQFKPFEDHFHLSVLAETTSERQCKRLEAHHIRLHEACGPNGYNIMKGHPPSTRKFWYLQRRRKL